MLSGKPTDVDFKDIFEKLYNKSAYFVMKNISKLTTKEFEEIKIEKGSADEVETKLIKEHLGQIKVAGMDALSTEKADGETVSTFETRLKSEIDNILDI